MPDKCRDFEPMFAPYVDGAAEPGTRAAVEAHLDACPPCRDRVAFERAAHEALHERREKLRGCASAHLRKRCEAQWQASPPAASPSPRLIRRTLVPLSLAASILLLAGSFVLIFSPQVEVLAAQLAVDHVKCFKFSSQDEAQRVDAVALSREWTAVRGWPVKVPESASDHHLQLLGMRRCGATDGVAAHMMYKWRGRPLSVYVMNTESKRATEKAQFVEALGEHAVIWKHDGRTYAVVADASWPDLAPVVRYLKTHAK